MRASSWSRDRLGARKMVSNSTWWIIWVKKAGEGVLLVQGQAGGQEDDQLQHLVDDLGEECW